MSAGTGVAVVLGVWLIVQVTRGHLLDHLGLS